MLALSNWLTLDEEKIKKQHPSYSFNLGPENKISRCLEILAIHSK